MPATAPERPRRKTETPAMENPDHAVRVLRRLSNILFNLDAAKTKRKEMQDAEKGLVSEIKSMGVQQPQKRVALAADLGDTYMLIDDLGDKASWFNGLIFDTIRQARQPGLYPVDENPTPPNDLFDEVEAKRKSEPNDKDQTRIPGTEPKTLVDQHLVASVGELDIRERLKGKLHGAGFILICDLVRFDAEHTANGRRFEQEIQAALEIGQGQAAEIKQALAAYLKRHTKAQAEKER